MFKKGDVVAPDLSKTVVLVLEDQTTDCFYGEVLRYYGNGGVFSEGQKSRNFLASGFKLEKENGEQQTYLQSNTFPVLKDGMVIETRCRGFYLVCADKVIRHDGYNRVTSYEKDGKHKGSNSNFDIIRVYSGEHLYNFDLYDYVSYYPQDLVWNGKKNADKIASLRSQVDSLQEQIKQLEEEDNV